MSTTTRPMAREVTVDSGSLLLIDPCYVIGKLQDREDWLALVDQWSARKQPSVDEPFGSGAGIFLTNFGGDGSYAVEIERDALGRVLSLHVQFAVDPDRDDFWLSDGESDDDAGSDPRWLDDQR